jgi:hypothetical protein
MDFKYIISQFLGIQDVGAGFKWGQFQRFTGPIGTTVGRVNLSKYFKFLNFQRSTFDLG